MKTRPQPPRPDVVRKPTGRFGWIEDRLLHGGWLSRLKPESTAVLLFLVLVADQQGLSWWGRERMALRLGLTRPQLDVALAQLQQLELVAHRPWRQGVPDGVWQVLPVPQAKPQPMRGQITGLGEILGRIGLERPAVG